jgi:thiosulfate/3-mercaptopyruvate sulfurtransferase
MATPLISVQELESELAETAPALLDVRWALGSGPDRDAYRAGHLPGAVFVDLDTDLSAPPGAGGRHPLPDPEVFEQAMRRCGVRADRPVVCYDAGDSAAAARAWWLLGYFGHEEVRVLDGGLRAWTEAGLPLHPGDAVAAPGDFTVRPGGRVLLDAEDAARIAEEGVLLDGRAMDRFHGKNETTDPVAGHIPGAVNVPTSRNLTEDGRFRQADELRAIYAEVGATPGVEVAAYCGSGVTATHDILAMEVAGIRAALYPGSWSGWIADARHPVDTGDGTVLRRPTAGDLPALVTLAEAVWPVAYDFDPEYAAYTIETWWTAESTAASLERTDWVVAERAGELIGAGNLDLGQDVPTVWKLLVHPDRQGGGTGTRILRALVRVAGDRGVRLAYVVGNRSAASFYAGLGFREVGRNAATDEQPEHVVVAWSPADGGPLAAVTSESPGRPWPA